MSHIVDLRDFSCRHPLTLVQASLCIIGVLQFFKLGQQFLLVLLKVFDKVFQRSSFLALAGTPATPVSPVPCQFHSLGALPFPAGNFLFSENGIAKLQLLPHLTPSLG
jgi:hypothetical protein